MLKYWRIICPNEKRWKGKTTKAKNETFISLFFLTPEWIFWEDLDAIPKNIYKMPMKRLYYSRTNEIFQQLASFLS